MLSKKPDTIQGFLSPTKLLSTSSKNSKFNPKGIKSPLGSPNYTNIKQQDSKYNSQNQSYMNTSRQIENPLQQLNDPTYSRITGQNNNNRLMATQPIGERKYYQSELDRETRTVTNYPNNFRKTNLSIGQEDGHNNNLNNNNHNHNRERTLQQINNNRKWQATQQYRDIDRQSPLYQSKLRNNNDPLTNIKKNFSIANNKSSVAQITNLKNGNIQTMTGHCYELIRKLSKVKQNLELQILQLQTLLDNTSKYMDNMQEEFDKIKNGILAYTAKCLDSAFTQYKQNMVEWQKYQDFQRKSLSMLTQMNQYIYNQEQKLTESKKLSYRDVTMTAQQIQRQVQYYEEFTHEIVKIREQCVGMRPTITEERIKEFEKGLAVLCNF